ncbi:S8 family serine peptidase [Thalassotalea psychrophila]|uniref:S8 family serine peptidase n=1 Tax=Thalassotalea psychrophila TaxID=3065647 RepID=A0ABY9TY99_9GAMM|nr:S8 family serine peptidase [Colwelliaceae bacterium SQ149]
MKFKLKAIIKALPLMMIGASASANVLDKEPAMLGHFVEDGLNNTILRTNANQDGVKSSIDITAQVKSTISDSYFVILNGEPLASYDGTVAGLAATNVLASKNTNITAKGKLNTKSLASKRYKSYLAGKQNETELHINLRLKRQIDVSQRYDTVLNGFATKLSKTEAMLVRQLDGVLAVDKIEMAYIDTDSGPSFTGAVNAWQGTYNDQGSRGEGMVVGIIDSGIASYLHRVEDILDTDNLPSFNPSFAAEVDEDGDGEIDFVHSNPRENNDYLGDCVDLPNWCNDKLIGVYGVGFLGSDELVAEYNPDQPLFADYGGQRNYTGQDTNGHGTHVASTAAGSVVLNVQTEGEIGGQVPDIYPNDFVFDKISGVAPRANIISYQVCDRNGGCFPNLAFEAIELAINDGVDVINYSISGAPSSPWYDWLALAYLNAREAGVWVASAAGNDGFGGRGTLRTPGNAPWITGVAAVTHDRGFEGKTLTLAGGSEDFVLETNVFTGEGATRGLASTDVVYAADIELSTAVEEFAIAGSCAIGSLTADVVKDKVVVCNRGGVDKDDVPLTRAVKSFSLYELGAKGLVLVNTKSTTDNIVSDMHSLPAVHLNKKDGKILLEWLAEGEGHQVAMSDSKLISSTSFDEDQDFSGLMGGFSSQGPDLFSPDYLVPHISAPGVGILGSGLGKDMQDFAVAPKNKTQQDQVYKSGTSMASPHVAGMFLLMKSAHPEWTPAEGQSALMLTAGSNTKVVGPLIKGKQTFVTANFHSSGAGLARVDLAIETGLIMHETIQGYRDADPFGDLSSMQLPSAPGEIAVPADEGIRGIEKEVSATWHGDTTRMNLASMAKGACIDSCSWTRTLKATKAATWQVSYSYNSKGMTLSSDKDGASIALSAGEEFTITVTATVDENLDSYWSDGRVILTSNDANIPAVSLPVTVNFVAGSVPDLLEITAHRDTGSVELPDVVTVGTTDFTADPSRLAKAKIYSAEIKRAAEPYKIVEELGVVSYSMPLTIPARSERVIIQILETSSPDLDVYLGQDLDLDGQFDRGENHVTMVAATGKALEKLDYDFPVPGDYWLMIHNFGNQFNDSKHDRFDPESAEIIDTIKFAVAVVEPDYDDDANHEFKVKADKQAYPNSNIPVTVSWEKDMEKDDLLFGSVFFSTSEDLPFNIGVTRVDISRGQDDVELTLATNDIEVEMAAFNIRFMANNTAEQKVYQMTMELASGAVLEQLLLNGETFDHTQTGNSITWTYTQAANAASETVSLVINYAEISGLTDITPVVSSVLNDSDYVQVSNSLTPVIVAGKPVAEVVASNTYAAENEQITLTANVTDAVIDNPELSYEWRQVSGQDLAFSNDWDSISFTTPTTNKDLEFVFELVVNNSERNSDPVLTTVYIDVEDSGSAGSTGFIWFAITLMALVIRRKSI